MKKIGVILGLFGLNLLYFSDTLTGRLLLAERDLTTFFYPFRYIWVETLRRGHFPFWNPYIKCGVPLFAALQPGVLYPLSLPYLFLPLDQVFNWTIILHFFLAAVFTYLLMREIGASMLGGAAAALAFLFSGYLISVHNVLNTLQSVSWYPLVVFCGCWLIRDGRVRWAVATGLGLCCMFLAGGIEIVIFSLASLVLLCCYPGLLNLSVSGNNPRAIHRLALLALSLIIFLGLSMIQFLPSLELYRHSSRYGGVSLEQAMRWSLPPRDLIYFLIPDLYGPRTGQDQYWVLQNYLKTIYAGPIVFFLSGFYFYRQGRRALPLLAVMGTVLILALGDNTPLYPIFYKYFPMFSTLRYPVKFLFLFVFSLSVTAGLGLDALALRFSEKRRFPAWAQGFFMVAVLVLAGLLVLSRFYPDRVVGWAFSWWGNFVNPTFLPKVLHNLSRLLVVATLGLIVIFFGLQRRMARMGSTLLLVLLVSDLFLGNRGFAVKLDAASFHATTEIIRTLNADTDVFRFHVRPEVKDVEVVVRDTYEEHHRIRKEALAYDLMMEHHLYDIDGYNVPIQPRYERVMSLIRTQPLADCRALLNLLNVKYVLTEGTIELPGYVLFKDGIGTTKLYENRNYLPRAFLVEQFQIVQNAPEFGEAFRDPNFNPGETILLEKEPTRFLVLKKESSIPGLESAVRLVAYGNNRMVMEVTTPEAALLFLSETFYPGWKAYVDGKEEEILRADYAFRAIPVGPGSHRIEVVCQPTSFKVGLTISLLTIVALLTAWAVLVRKRQV